MKNIFLILLAVLLPTLVKAQTEARLLRFPTQSGNNIVFTFAGDIYQVDVKGGTARRLTSDPNGYEMFAHFSPDGKHIAFTGQYDGNTEVYVMPAQGGSPKRLTYTATLNRDDVSDRMGPNNIVMGWKDANTIIYRSRKQSFNDFKGQLFTVSINGGLSQELPLPAGGFCSYSPDQTKLAYNQIFREFRTWKYYRGGMADDISIYDFATKATIKITQNKAQDIFPMWHGETIYYISDRDRIMNLFAYNTVTRTTSKVTAFDNYDIKFPTAGDKGIVFENGGYLYLFDYNTQKAEKITIYINDDLSASRKQIKDASKFINSWSLSPDGKRMAFGARGDVFTVPAKNGITRNLTQSSGAHDRNVNWSPDGKNIAFISDMSGEDEIYLVAQDGSSKPVQITKNSDTYKYSPDWSPDSKKLLWADKKMRLQYVDVNTKKVMLIAHNPDGELTDYAWSPDSKWIAYSKQELNKQAKIWIFNTETGTTNAITDYWYDCSSPTFSPDGKYLFFVSNRDFNPTYSNTEWNHAYTDMSRIYFVTLEKNTKNPLKPEADEVNIANSGENKEVKPEIAKAKDKKEDAKNTVVTVQIDFDGITQRVVDLPIEAANYGNLTAVRNSLYYIKYKENKVSINLFDLEEKKETNLGNYGSFIISFDQKKMAISSGNYYIIDLPKSRIELKEELNLSGMKVMTDLSQEWNQIFNESWRQMRDFFYDPNMHGVNWNNIRLKYQPLVSHVNQRADLTYIIGEMIGELNVGHAYTGGGDKPSPKRLKLGLLGAKLNREASGYYKITSIYPGENWVKSTRSPLTEVGVDAKVGDYIIAIDGNDVTSVNDIYELLIDKANKETELTLNSKPSAEGSRKVLITPIDDENGLVYLNWVRTNIEKVNKATNGEVGYIHIPDMGVEGLNEFVKYFYPQLSKRALIIDDRGNGGGNVSPMIIERLSRKLAMMRIARNSSPYPSGIAMHLGPKICLIDQYSASDGDLFPYQFKYFKLGKLVGVRTWGGVVGIRGSLPFIDGGMLTKPEFSHYAADGSNWIIEGTGVEPDVEVVNDPAKEYAGEDQQLNKAIELILEELKNYPKELPKAPNYPDKSK